MNMLRKFAMFLVVAMSCSTVLGALVPVATLVRNPPGTPFNAPDAALPAPWVSYQLSIQATAGELVGAVDVAFAGNKLHQRWNDTDFDGITNPSPSGAPSNGRGDSHLTSPAGSPFGFGPTETNTLAGSPLLSNPGTTEYGVGNLAGAWAILAPGAVTNLAYIVVQAGDLPTIDITVKSANPQGVANAVLFGRDFFPQVTGVAPSIQKIDLGEVEGSAGIIMAMLDDGPADPAATWSNLVPTMGSPALAATLGADGKFSWNPAGSLAGHKGSGNVMYKWNATATNASGESIGAAIMLTLIPEPATLSLVGLAMIGFLGLARRRS